MSTLQVLWEGSSQLGDMVDAGTPGFDPVAAGFAVEARTSPGMVYWLYSAVGTAAAVAAAAATIEALAAFVAVEA